MQIKHNRIKNYNWREATSWLFTSVAEDLYLGWQIQQVARAGLEPGIVWLLVWRADHSAMLPSTAASHKMSLTYNYLDGLIIRNREAAGGWTV